MYCTQCGKKISKSNKFCNFCGKQLVEKQSNIQENFDVFNSESTGEKINRINRKTYLISAVLLWVIVYLCAFIIGFIHALITGDITDEALAIYQIVLTIPFLVYGIKLSTLRLHDLGNSGWYILLGIVPLLNIIFYIYILLGRGEEEKNAYGDPPSPKLALKNAFSW